MSSLQSKWLAFLDDHLLDDPAQPNAFFWCGLNEQGDLSANDSWCEKDRGGKEKACTRKRLRDEPCSGAATKACREKMRRDRLNERFLELSTILESGKAPKTDKVVVLGDALHALNQLKAEAQQLRDSNEKLREAIKKLRVEKSELREERVKLKAQKDQLEQQLKAVAMPATACYLPHPAALHAAMAAFAAQNQVAGTKGAVPGYPGMGMGMGMWQWMTPAALDTSQDHMLRPPVA